MLVDIRTLENVDERQGEDKIVRFILTPVGLMQTMYMDELEHQD